MPKIVFIAPPYNLFMESLDAPFSLMYLAAVAEKEGWEAEIVDMESLDYPLPDADVYGVGSSSPQWPQTIKLSERLADEFPDSLKIVGGNHISSEPDDLDSTMFDSAILGEAEIGLADTLNNFEFAKGMRIIPSKRINNLDSIPFPARHLVDWTKYKRGIYWGKEELSPAVSIISSRGCPRHCCFCGSNVVFGRQTRFRSVENVVSEVKHVIETMGYHGFNFHDDTFSLNRDRVIRLCKEFERLDVVWRCLCRADALDKKLLNSMYLGGCREIVLGLESGSQKILDNLQKGTMVEQNLHGMKLIKESGIQLKAGIIVGSPGETWETVEETKNMLRQYPPVFWNMSVFTPFPGADVWKNPEKYKIKILTRDLRKYAMVGRDYRGSVVVETEEMSKEDIEQARDELIDLLLDISGPTYELKPKIGTKDEN